MFGAFAGAKVRPDSDEAYLRERALMYVPMVKPDGTTKTAQEAVADAEIVYRFLTGQK